MFDSERKQTNQKQLKNKTQNFYATKYPVLYLIPLIMSESFFSSQIFSLLILF